MPKYDITNPLLCDRVIHDVRQRPVHVARGETKYGVELSEADADRLQTLAATGKDVELTLTPAEAPTPKPTEKPTPGLKK